MRPNFKIIANGAVVDFRDRLISLSLNDNDGYKNDKITIAIDDRDNTIDVPKTGVELEIWLGYGDNLFNKGSFEVDSVKISGMPDKITITAKGSKVNSSLKIQRTQTYLNKTLGDILATIAERSGMSVKISEILKDVQIKHLNQINESDQNLLSRLKRDYDAEFKSIASNLLFYHKDDFKTVGGQQLKPIVIDKSDCTAFDFEQTDKSKYASVVAKWRDVSKSEVKEAVVGLGKPIYTMKELFASETEANQRATTKYNDLLRGEITGNLACVGNPLIAGEFEIILTGFRKQLQTKYKCVSSSHLIDQSGYKTSLKVVNKK